MATSSDALFSFEGPDANPGFLLAQVTGHWQRQLAQALAPMQLSPLQFLLLVTVQRLSQHEEPITQAVLSARTHTDKMTTSKTVRALEEKGLLERPVHAQDARARSLTLTQAGLKAAVRAAWAVEEFDQLFFGSAAASLVQTLQPLRPTEPPAEGAPLA